MKRISTKSRENESTWHGYLSAKAKGRISRKFENINPGENEAKRHQIQEQRVVIINRPLQKRTDFNDVMWIQWWS